MYQEIKSKLNALAEPDYAVFARRLLPGTENILGVRLPRLRTLARRIARENWRVYLDTARADTFEEIMLQGMVIGYLQAPLPEVLSQIAAFIPKIDNWSVCDSFCSGLKIARIHPNAIWNFFQPYLAHSNTYHVRFAVVMMLFYYIDDVHIDLILSQLSKIQHDDYYVKTAVAWALSLCCVAYPPKTLNFLSQNLFDTFTHNKAIQKIAESRQTSAQIKTDAQALKRLPILPLQAK